jgi:hypothetical protein
MAEITNMERNPYANQGGNPAIIQEEQEIEIVLPSEGGIEIEDLLGGMEEFSYNHNENLVESLDSDELDSIAGKVIEGFEADKESRGEWEDTFEKGFDLLGLKLRETTEPFEGACTAVHPLLIESAVKFQSKAIQELFPSKGPVKTQIIGNPTTDKDRQATRVMNFMNYQLTDQMPEYFSELERMLFNLPIFGSAFKKTYWDMSFERPMSEFIPIEQFYVSNFASDLQNAERYTHVVYRSPNDLKRDIESGMYTLDHYDEDRLPRATPVQPTPITSKMNMIMGISPNYDEEPQYTILEQHCYLEIEEEIDEDENALTVALPYIVSVDEHTRKVLCIRRNWAETDPRKEKLLWFTHYRFVPGFGFYGLGFIHFLGNLTATATSAVRNLIDAGQFATLPGGFKARGVRIVGSNDAIAPGEFKEVEATGIDLTKSIIPLPYKEPSSTLMQMLQFVTAAGQKFADSTEQVIADSTNYGPVGTTLALLEASTKFFSAIHKRLHYSQRQELKILSRINFDFLPNEYPYDLANIEGQIFKNDFDGRIDIIPVSDPNVPSASHRLAMAQTVMQMAQQAPAGMFNLREINRTMLDAAGIENPDQFLIPEQEPQPLDPISDINAIAQGMPIKSFPGQDHQAHIAVKQAFLADPTLGQNEMMQSLVPVLQANIREHMIMQYEEQMAGMLQNGVEEAGSGSPEAISKITQGAAQEILQNNQRMAAMGTPEDLERMTLDLQRQQLELERERLKIDAAQKAADIALAEEKLQIDASTKAANIALDEEKLDLQRNSLEVEAAEKLAKIKGVAKDRNIVAESKAADRDDKFLLKMMDLLIKETGTTVEKLKEEVVLRPEIYQEGGITVPMMGQGMESMPQESRELLDYLGEKASEKNMSLLELFSKINEVSAPPVGIWEDIPQEEEEEIDTTVEVPIFTGKVPLAADRTGHPISPTTGERFDPLEAQREAALREREVEDEKLMEEAIRGDVPARPPVTQEAEKSIFHLTYKDFRDRLRHAETGGEDDPWIFTHSKKDENDEVSSAFGPSQITYTLAGDVLKKVPKKDKEFREYIQKFIKQGKASFNLEKGRDQRGNLGKKTKINQGVYGRGKSGNIPLEEHKKYYPRLEEMAIDQKRKIGAVNNIDDLLKAWYPGAAKDKDWRERFNLSSEEG